MHVSFEILLLVRREKDAYVVRYEYGIYERVSIPQHMYLVEAALMHVSNFRVIASCFGLSLPS